MIQDLLHFSQECGAIRVIISRFIKNGEEYKGTPIQVTDQNGEKKVVRKPTFSENLRFMFSYQFGYMYFRYFMWNFSGKQNDTQGTGGAVNGNWITGIKFLDEPRVGTSDLPADMKNDTSRNKYYLLPFLLGTCRDVLSAQPR